MQTLRQRDDRKDQITISSSTSPKVEAGLKKNNQSVHRPVEKSGPLPTPLIRLDLLRIVL